MPKAASATAAHNAHARTTADVHRASTHMHSAAADVHSASAATSATTMTAAAVTAAAARQKHGRRHKQARGNGASKKSGTQHDDPPLRA
jgi:hypothetical protein